MGRQGRWIAGGLALLVAVVAGLVGWRLLSEAPAEAGGRRGGKGAVVAVAVAPVTVGPLEATTTISGSVEANATVALAVERAGRVVAVEVELGDTIQPEAVLLRLDAADAQLQLAEAGAALQAAEATVQQAASSIGLRRAEAERAEALLQDGVIATAEAELARAAAAVAGAALAAAEAERARASAARDVAELQLQRSSLRAPPLPSTAQAEQWHLADRRVEGGEWVGVGDTVFTLVSLRPLRVELQVPESIYHRLQPGLPARLHTDAAPGASLLATVSRIGPRFERATRQAQVELTVTEGAELLRPGMFVRATLILERRENVKQVPEAALVSRDGEPVVFVLSQDGQSVRRLPVEIGIRGGDMLQATHPDLDGKVVVLGQQFLKDGSRVSLPAKSQ